MQLLTIDPNFQRDIRIQVWAYDVSQTWFPSIEVVLLLDLWHPDAGDVRAMGDSKWADRIVTKWSSYGGPYIYKI